MNYLFDTSAIINLIQKKKKLAADILKGQSTIDLAYYEAGNVVWKLFYRKLLTLKDCKQLLEDLQGIWSLMKIIPFSTGNMLSIFEIAQSQKITFYDAAYLFCFQQTGAIFITDDDKLSKVGAELGQVDSSTRFDQSSSQDET